MPTLKHYHHFAGRHHETGTLHNYFAYCNMNAPHTGAPYSEALLLGISGGIVMGYFTFAYEGYDPHVALLTRNTFDPMETMLSRLGVVQEIRQTNKADKGLANLLDTLADGMPAIIWADIWSLPYNAFAYDEGMWGMAPLIVYGYDSEQDQVLIADRASLGLTITTAELATARARVKKDKFRVMTLDQPDEGKVVAAVTAGLWDCINLYTEKPPKGAAKSWGLKAFDHWSTLLTKPKQRQSWAKEFPAGPKLYAGLTSALSHFDATGIGNDAERSLYAGFLDEAAQLLGKPQLNEVAKHFRHSAVAWQNMAKIMLPDTVEGFGESRQLLQKRRARFIEQGMDALPELHRINDRLREIRAALETNFPLTKAEVTAHHAAMADQLQKIQMIEATAIDQLRSAMVE